MNPVEVLLLEVLFHLGLGCEFAITSARVKALSNQI